MNKPFKHIMFANDIILLEGDKTKNWFVELQTLIKYQDK